MWTELKNWIARGGQRLPRGKFARRALAPFEQLETRAVLSAAMPTVAVDFDGSALALTAVFVEHLASVRPPLLVREMGAPPMFEFFAPELPPDGLVEGDAALASNWDFAALPRPLRPEPPAILMSGAPIAGKLLHVETADSAGISPEDAPPEIAASAENGISSKLPLGLTTSSTGPTAAANSPLPQGSRVPDPRFHFAFRRAADDYFQALGTATPVGQTTTVELKSNGTLHRKSLATLTADTLLLASTTDDASTHDKVAAISDELLTDTTDTETDGDHLQPHLLFDEALSLDALQRERAAVDAVLATLDEIELPARSESHTDARLHQESATTITVDPNFQFTTSHPAPAAPEANGGMVLLATVADPNSGAYELATDMIREQRLVDRGSVGVEAALGMVQAIDIGTSNTPQRQAASAPLAQPTVAQPTVARPTIAQPTSAQPNVSAENAPANKSEQPT